jgi:predicted nucleic acid-binding protein
MILEVAVASKSTFIVTFNKRDFVAAEKFGIVVLSPGEFLKILEVKS